MLQLTEVSKTYGEQTVLQPTTLTVSQGKTTVLIGPSGCGKSTLLRLVIGLISPDQGEVKFDSELVRPETILLLRRRMGYVIQEGGLFPHLTVAANVSLMATYLGWERSRIQHRMDELAELTRLPKAMLNRYPGQVSGGQRQRVSLMRALMLDPDLLLLDEPLGALDPMIRSELQSELKQIFHSLQKTVVFVTHDLAEAAYFGDTIVLLRNGHVLQQGSFQELSDEPADPFVTEFIQAQRPLFAEGLA